jgi:hypothetical protein
MGVDVGVGVAVSRIRVGVAVGDGVKLGIVVGVCVAVDGIDVGVFDGVAGSSDGVRLDVGMAVSTSGFGPGVDMLAAVDVGDAASTLGAVTVFEDVHAVKINHTIKQHRCRYLFLYHPIISVMMSVVLLAFWARLNLG